MFDDFDSREPPFLTEAERFLAYIHGVLSNISIKDLNKLCENHPEFFCVRISLQAFIEKVAKSKNKEFFLQDCNKEINAIETFVLNYKNELVSSFKENHTVKKYKM